MVPWLDSYLSHQMQLIILVTFKTLSCVGSFTEDFLLFNCRSARKPSLAFFTGIDELPFFIIQHLFGACMMPGSMGGTAKIYQHVKIAFC